jgi:hypothetical protein
MKFSMLPILLLIQLMVMYRATKNTETAGNINSRQRGLVNTILVALGVWAAMSSYFSLSGIYQTETFLASLPGFWITQIPILIVMIPWMLSKSLRQATDSIIDHTSLSLIMAFEGLRVFALGGIIKGYNGEFSPLFAKAIGIPDFFIGLLALTGAYLIYKGVLGNRAAITINLLGFIVIIPFGMGLINLGLKGPLYFIHETPSTATIFDFPMALAPTLVVPIFVMVNLFVAIRLIQKEKLREIGKIETVPAVSARENLAEFMP